MDSIFWLRVHGGVTHFPIALVFGAAFFETIGLLSSSRQHDFRSVSYWLLVSGGISSFGAVFSGLALSKWTISGKSLLLQHHLFVWPAFALIVGLTSWRVAVGQSPSRRACAIYLSLLATACALLGAAGFSRGELLLGRSSLTAHPLRACART
jgi:uncharacterized membrane protein